MVLVQIRRAHLAKRIMISDASANCARSSRVSFETLVEQRQAALAALFHQRAALGGHLDAEAAFVFAVGAFGDEAFRFEIGDEL